MALNGTNSAAKPASAFDTSSTIPLWLNGAEVTTSTTFDVIAPIDQRVLYKASSASEEDVLRAIEAAENAFKTWSKTKPNERRDIFIRAAEEMKRRRDELYQYTYNETGEVEVMFGFEFNVCINSLLGVAGLIQVATTATSPILSEEGKSGLMVKEPYGVVLGIAPWNAPYALGLRACLQPLAMGNTVILKGPEVSPATYWAVSSVLHAAGLPAGALNTIYHRPTDAAQLTSLLIAHPSIKKISFTGSTAVGAIIASQAGRHLKPTIMELGGKNPSIVCEDADIPSAALQCALGAFLHAGQICMSTDRVIVHAKVIDEFRVAFKASLDHIFANDQSVPQLVASIGVVKNKKLLADAIAKGASTLYGDATHNDASETRMRPVVIENVNSNMDIYHTEAFGPTTVIYVVDSDDAAVVLANDTEYGLSSSVFTQDLRRGFKIAKQIESGAVHINGMSVHDEPALPHGGLKKSGFGRFNGLSGLDEWVKTKNITWMD